MYYNIMILAEIPLLLQEPENVTAVVGEAVMLQCTVPDQWPGQEMPPRVLWHARRTGRVHPGLSVLSITIWKSLLWIRITFYTIFCGVYLTPILMNELAILICVFFPVFPV